MIRLRAGNRRLFVLGSSETPRCWDMRDSVFSLGPPWLVLVELLAALGAVGGERADEFVVEVCVDELTDLDDSHDRAGVTLAECDRQAVVADDAVAPHLSQE